MQLLHFCLSSRDLATAAIKNKNLPVKDMEACALRRYKTKEIGTNVRSSFLPDRERCGLPSAGNKAYLKL